MAAGDLPEWVLFDLNGTLLDPATIAEPLGLERDAGAGILDEAVAQAVAGAIAGVYRPLPDCMRAAVRRRAELRGLRDHAVDDAMERARAMPAFPEVAEALGVLSAAGCRVGVLTNSAREAAEHALAAAGLGELVELVAGGDEVRAYKPDPRVYAHGLQHAGAPPDAVVLVAAHWWDVLGAARFGLRTGWVSRRERRLLETVPAPEFSGENVLEVARAIVGRPAARG